MIFNQYQEPTLIYSPFPFHLARGLGHTAGLGCFRESAGSGDAWLREGGLALELVPWLLFTGT